MISKVDNIIKTLEKKEKIISYLKSIYKVEVGEEPTIPEAYIDQNILDDKNLENNLLKLNILEPNQQDGEETMQYSSFHEKVISLRFPSLQDKTIKQKIAKIKKEKEKNPSNKNYYQQINDLDLSGYGEKEFNYELLKQVCDTMKLFKTLTSLNLSRNSIDDSYVELLAEFLAFPTLKKINLSFNQIGKNAMKKLIPLLRNNLALESLDFRCNPFCLDEHVCSNICQALKGNSNLVYFALCDFGADAPGMKMLQQKNKNLQTLILEDCRYKPKTYEILRKALIDKKSTLNYLSLKLNTIEINSAHLIEKGIRFNKSLVYINLSNCGLSDLSAAKLISALEQNKTLSEIDLAQNKLANLFCAALGKVLKLNNKLSKINISRNNNIKDADFQFVVECLVDNQSIVSLGNLEETKIGIKLRESVEIILQLNRQFSSSQISLENTQAQKIDFLKASVDNFNKENKEVKSKLDHDKKLEKIGNDRDNFKSDEDVNFDELIIKYGVEFHVDDYQDFYYEQQ